MASALAALWLAACAADSPTRPPAPAPTGPAKPPALPAGKTWAPIAERVAPIPFDAAPLALPPAPKVAWSSRSHSIQAKVKPYALPLALRQVRNFERDVAAKTKLFDAGAVKRPLLRDGMVVVDAVDAPERFDDAYQRLFAAEVPVMVTMDSLLHLYHVYFQEILKAIETRSLAPMLEALLEGVHREMLSVAEGAGGELREPALIAVAYLAVPLKILRPEFEPHPAVAKRVKKDVDQIEKHAGLGDSSAMSLTKKPTAVEDFSQYVPRGHYTQSETLRRYFKASMWLGRVPHRFGKPHEILSQALLLQALERARCRFAEQELSAIELVGRIDRLLDFFVGETDDLGPTEVDAVLAQQIGGRDLHALAASPAELQRLEKALRELRPPRILSNAVQLGDLGEDAQGTLTKATQGLRLLGQRYAPDSDLLGRLVFEFVGPDPSHPRFREVAGQDMISCADLDVERSRLICLDAVDKHGGCASDPACRERHPESENQAFSQVCRLMPSGLDVAAVLGSRRARELSRGAERYCDYSKRVEQMTEHWAKISPDTLYAGWLAALRPLLQKPGAGFPTWVRGAAYEDKALTTALASWSELRHDTILYVKQSYTLMVLVSETVFPPKLYATVEPAPDVLVGLLRLSENTRAVLTALNATPREVDASLKQMEQLLEKLLAILERQLTGAPRDPSDGKFLMQIGKSIAGMTENLAAALAPPPPPPKPGEHPKANRADSREATRTTLVADVHTDLNTGRVLEEGVGKIRWLLAVDRNPDGQLSVSVGPVFSHYEFVHLLSDRLTDEKWRKLLDSGEAPPRTSGPVSNGFQRFCTPETPGCQPAR